MRISATGSLLIVIMLLENNVSFWQHTKTTVKLEAQTVHVEGAGAGPGAGPGASQTVIYIAYDGASFVPKE